MHQTVAVLVSDTTLTVEFKDGETRAINRTTTQPVRSIKGQRPRIAGPHFLGDVSHIHWQTFVAHLLSDHRQGRKDAGCPVPVTLNRGPQGSVLRRLMCDGSPAN